MGDVVDFEGFRQRKLDKLVAQWEEYMARASELQRLGKKQFADQMIKKAQELRPQIDKLRTPPRLEEQPAPLLNPTARVTGFTYSADMGYPKTMKPEPENN